jgi:hypothetical protein
LKKRRAWLALVLLASCSKGQAPASVEPPARQGPPATQLPEPPTQDDTEPLAEVPSPTAQDLAALPAFATETVDFATAQARTGDALVWRTTGMGIETLWIQLLAGKPTQVLARRAGLWFAVGPEIWGLHTTLRHLTACDLARCQADDTDCTPTPARNSLASVEDLVVVGLTSHRREPLGPKLPDSTARALVATHLAVTVRPLGQWSDRLELEVRTRYTPCGQTEERQRVDVQLRELPHGLVGPVAGPGEQAAVLEADARQADAQFQAIHGRTLGTTRWAALHQDLSPDGTWALVHQVDREVEQGPGDGETGPGRVSLRIPAHRLPSPLAELAEGAPHAQGLPPVQDPAPDPHAGWSWLREVGPARDALLAAFQKSKAAP